MRRTGIIDKIAVMQMDGTPGAEVNVLQIRLRLGDPAAGPFAADADDADLRATSPSIRAFVACVVECATKMTSFGSMLFSSSGSALERLDQRRW